jgi:DNA-binding FadR family transcriptional regulator
MKKTTNEEIGIVTEMIRLSVAERLKAYLREENFELNSRLPPERKLAEDMGVSRANLRSALAKLEAEGRIWRHVGKGTFIGSRPIETDSDADRVSSRTTPRELIEARMLIEPGLAGLAALHATKADISNMEHCIRKTKTAPDWRVYEAWDNKLHLTFAEAAHNIPLMSLFNMLNSIRRLVVWGRPRDIPFVRKQHHHSINEHDAIFNAISERNVHEAEQAMRSHLESVGANLLRVMEKSSG